MGCKQSSLVEAPQNRSTVTFEDLSIKLAPTIIRHLSTRKTSEFNENVIVEISDEDSCNFPLHVAASSGDLETVKTLLLNDAAIKIINCQDNDDNTALHLAIAHDHFECAKLLLSNGADESIENTAGFVSGSGLAGGKSIGTVALITATTDLQVDEALKMIEAKLFSIDASFFREAYLKSKSTIGWLWTPTLENRCQKLILIIEQLNFKKRLAVDSSKVNDSLDNYGNRAVHLATCQGDIGALYFLICAPCHGLVDIQTDPNQDGTGGNTALHYAITYCKLSCAFALLLLGASGTVTNAKGYLAKTGMKGKKVFLKQDSKEVTLQINASLDYFASHHYFNAIGSLKFQSAWMEAKNVFGDAWTNEIQTRCAAISRYLGNNIRENFNESAIRLEVEGSFRFVPAAKKTDCEGGGIIDVDLSNDYMQEIDDSDSDEEDVDDIASTIEVVVNVVDGDDIFYHFFNHSIIGTALFPTKKEKETPKNEFNVSCLCIG